MFLPLVLGFVLITAYFAPLFFAGASAVPGTFPDVWVFIWNIDRLKDVWAAGEQVYHTERIFHPFGTSLALHTQAEGLSLPISLLEPVLGLWNTYSFAVYLCCVLNFIAAYLLFKTLGASNWFSSVLALSLSFHANFIGHINGGHLNFLCFFPVAIWLRSFFRVLLSKENLRYDWLILSLSVGFTGFVNLYYLYFIALFGLTIGSAALLRFRSKVTRNVIGAACCTLLGVVLCSYKLYLVTTAYLSKAYSLDHESGSHAANVLFYFLPSENQLLGKLADFSLPTYVPDLSSVELGTYLGLGLFLFLICGLRLITQNRECRWMVLSFAAAGVFFVFLSLGPTIRIAGFPLIPNSIFLIFNDLPFFPSVPIRIGFLAVLLFYCLAASVISRIPRASAIGVLAIMLVEQFPVGLPIGDVPQSQAVASLKSRTDVVAVHDFAVGRQHKLARQLEHRKSVTKAFVARAPIAPNKSYRDNVFLRYVRKSESVAAEASRSEVPDNKALEQGITALDIQAVICETGKPKVLEAIQQSELFDELARDDGFVVYVKR